MAVWPGDHGAAGVAGLRASDADRDRAVDVLRAAFAQGLLTREELGARTALALKSRTFGELTALTAGLLDARPPAEAARKPVARKVAAWSACMVIPAALATAFLSYYGGFIVLLVLAFIGTVMTGGPVRGSAQRR